MTIRHWGISIICIVLSWAMVACGTTGAATRNQPPLTLEALYAYCAIPSSCTAAAWENQWVTVTGYADPKNIYQHRHHPNLAYEKFWLIDRRGKVLEVWINSADSRPIFSKIYQTLDSQITIKGRLAIVKMPSAGGCRRSAKVWIDDPSQIQ
jgi:hypothetical protein